MKKLPSGKAFYIHAGCVILQHPGLKNGGEVRANALWEWVLFGDRLEESGYVGNADPARGKAHSFHNLVVAGLLEALGAKHSRNRYYRLTDAGSRVLNDPELMRLVIKTCNEIRSHKYRTMALLKERARLVELGAADLLSAAETHYGLTSVYAYV